MNDLPIEDLPAEDEFKPLNAFEMWDQFMAILPEVNKIRAQIDHIWALGDHKSVGCQNIALGIMSVIDSKLREIPDLIYCSKAAEYIQAARITECKARRES